MIDTSDFVKGRKSRNAANPARSFESCYIHTVAGPAVTVQCDGDRDKTIDY